jgi:ribosome production factor 2
MKKNTQQEKNVSTDALDGKVGRLYVPRQDLAGLALAKAKGVKRARREAAAERAASAGAGGGGGGAGGSGGEESE